MAPSSSSLISASELAAQLDSVRLLDVRWFLNDHEKGRANYEAGHIPGAVFVDIDRDVTGEVGAGRHPLPHRERFEHAMRQAGVDAGAHVVVCDDVSGSVASRLWWLLKIFGHDDAFVLDGGIQTWDGPLSTETPVVTPGDFVAKGPDLSGVLSYEDVVALDGDTVLIDIRAPERYRGENEPVDPKAGHIPGAKNAFWQETLIDDHGRFLGPDELRSRFEALGVRPGNAVVYCGSGLVSCQTALAIEEAGLGPARIYSGSWSDWSTREDAPVATGSE